MLDTIQDVKAGDRVNTNAHLNPFILPSYSIPNHASPVIFFKARKIPKEYTSECFFFTHN